MIMYLHHRTEATAAEAATTEATATATTTTCRHTTGHTARTHTLTTTATTTTEEAILATGKDVGAEDDVQHSIVGNGIVLRITTLHSTEHAANS